MASGEEKTYCDLLTPVVCGNCEGQDDVLSYCLQCHANICDECKCTHCDANLTRDHIILHRTHPEVVKARRSKKIYCPKHTGKEYVTYCMRCSIPCCGTCLANEHNGHEFSELEKMITKTESEVDQLIRNLETDFIPYTENAVSTLEEEISSYKIAMRKLKQSARGRIQRLKQQLDEAEKTFLAEVDEHGEKELTYIESTKREVENNLEYVKSLAAKGKIAPVDVSLIYLKDELSKLDDLIPIQLICPGNLSFNPSTFQLSSAFDIIGSFNNDAEKVLPDASTLAQHDTLLKRNVKRVETTEQFKVSSVLYHHGKIANLRKKKRSTSKTPTTIIRIIPRSEQ